MLTENPSPLFWSVTEQQEYVFQDDLQREELTEVVMAAKNAKAFPDQSKFFVLTAALTESGIRTGGNAEHSLNDAFVHGETSVLANVLAEEGRVPIKALGFYYEGASKHSFGCPCGRCRDILRHYCSPEMLMLQGNERIIAVSMLSDYYKDTFLEVDLETLENIGRDEAIESFHTAVTAYLPDSLRNQVYGVSLVSEAGAIWSGSFYSNAGYDAVTPALSAILTWRNMSPEIRMRKVVIAVDGIRPVPFYRDRQALLEFDQSLQIATGRETPLPIEVLNVDMSSGKVRQAHVTNSVEFLPYPFSPRDFGMEDALMKQIQTLQSR